MTPLAQRIMRELAGPAKRRTVNDWSGAVFDQIGAAVTFESTAVADLMFDTFGPDKPEALSESASRLSFLPAPVTWLEVLHKGERIGYLLWREGDWINGAVVIAGKGNGCSLPFLMQIPHLDHTDPDCAVAAIQAPGGYASRLGAAVARQAIDSTIGHAGIALGHLAFINTPRVIGRAEHAPHAGLRCRIAKVRSKAPLQAWHEIKLEVTPPSAPRTKLTGTKAFHFCRSHVRVVRGELEETGAVVPAHWRGDQSRGVILGHYVVTPPKPGMNQHPQH